MANSNTTLKARKEEAGKILNEINETSNKVEEIHQSIQNILLKATVEKGEINKNNRVLLDVINKSTDLINTYRAERDRIKTVTRQIDKFHQKSFTPLMAKIDDPQTGFKNKIKESETLLKESKAIKNHADNQLIRLRKLVNEYKAKIDSLRRIEKSIIQIDKEIKQKNNNISRINELADVVKNQIVLKKESVFKSEREVSRLEIQVQKNNSTVKDLLNKIKEYEEEAGKLLGKIRQFYKITSSTGLAGAFNERKKEYEIEFIKWQKKVFNSTIFLIILILALYLLHLIQNWDKTIEYNADFYIRFLITSPLVFYLTFSANQHSKARKNHEKYSLRTTVALSIESHLELLANNPLYSKEKSVEKILDFILNTFNNLYKETLPEEKKRKKRKEEKEYIDNKFEMVLDLLKDLTKIKINEG